MTWPLIHGQAQSFDEGTKKNCGQEVIAARTAAWNTVHQQTGLPRPKDEPKIKILRDGPGRSTTTSLSFHLHEEAHPYVEKN